MARTADCSHRSAHALAALAMLLSACEQGSGTDCLSCVDGLGPIEIWIPAAVSEETAEEVVAGANAIAGSDCFRLVRASWEGGEGVPPAVVTMEVGPCDGIGCTSHYLPARGSYRVVRDHRNDPYVHLHELTHIMLMRGNEAHTSECGLMHSGGPRVCQQSLDLPEGYSDRFSALCERLLD